MKRKSKIIFLLILIGIIPFRMQGESAVDAAVEHFISIKGFEYASIGISLRSMTDGKSLAGYNQRMSLVPASTLKLVTTATASSLYPADYTFRTCVYYTGTILSDGVLKGNLIIRGSGDPSLASAYSLKGKNEFFQGVSAALQTLGIKKITGRIISDASCFDMQGVSPSWIWEDLGNYYAAGCYGVNYADNLYELTLDTSIKNCRPKVKSVSPDFLEMKFDNCLLESSWSYDSAFIYGAPFVEQRQISGAVPQKNAQFVLKGDLPDPALTMAKALDSYLRRNSVVTVLAPATDRVLGRDKYTFPKDAVQIYCYESDPLSHILKVTNNKSNNLYAEALLRLVAMTDACKTASAQAGIAEIRDFWGDKQLPVGALMMKDGCGLAPSDRVSAEFLTSLLYIMKDNSCFVTSIPLAGQEGTVRNFLKNTPLSGKARLKSGTISGVISYSGYVNTSKGSYAVAVIVNAYTLKPYQVRKAIEKLLADMAL